jgi:hypothetical protein
MAVSGLEEDAGGLPARSNEWNGRTFLRHRRRCTHEPDSRGDGKRDDPDARRYAETRGRQYPMHAQERRRVVGPQLYSVETLVEQVFEMRGEQRTGGAAARRGVKKRRQGSRFRAVVPAETPFRISRSRLMAVSLE